MTAIFSVILSIFALGFSLYVFAEGRRRDRRDLFLRIHDLLLSEDALRGRHILFDKVTDEASVERLSDLEYRDTHRAIGLLNDLAFYMKRGYVSEADVLDMWGVSGYRACLAAQPVILQRVHRTGYPPWPYIDYLMQKTGDYLTRKGTMPKFVVWHRSESPPATSVEGTERDAGNDYDRPS